MLIRNQPLSHAALHFGIQQGNASERSDSALGDAETARRMLLALAEEEEHGLFSLKQFVTNFLELTNMV